MSAAPAPSYWQLQHALADLADTARQLLADNPNMPEEDQELWAGMLEGEAAGDPFKRIDQLVNSTIEAEHFAEAIRARRTELAERMDRFTKRAERQRDMIQRVLELLSITRLQRPDYSLSVSDGPPKVLVTDVAALPTVMTRTTIEPDKALIGKALKAGEHIPGATLSNPAPVLRILSR